MLISQAGALRVTEGTAATATWSLRLSQACTAAVTVTVLPDAQLQVVGPASVTFTPGDWNLPQTVEVEAAQDLVAEGEHVGVVSHAVSSPGTVYDGLAVQLVSVAIGDDDSPGIAVAPVAGLSTDELGASASFTVVLSSQPASTVSIPLASSEPGQGLPSPASLSFDAGNWNVPQTVTVTGQDGNAFEDGDVPYLVQVGPAASADSFYQGLAGASVSLVNLMRDHPPTLDPLPASLALEEDDPPQSFALSGISNGQAGEAQPVSVSAAVTAGDPALLASLAVAHAPGASTGTLSFSLALHASGTAAITVTVGDGVATTASTLLLTVADVNQVPVVLAATGVTVSYRGSATYGALSATAADPGQLAASDVETPAAALEWLLLLPPASGRLELLGTPLAAGDTFTQAQVDAGALVYLHLGGAGASDGFAVQVADGQGGLGPITLLPVTIDRQAPAIDLLPGIASWTEEGAAAVFGSSAQVADDDSTDFNGGRLRLTTVSGGVSGDRLVVIHEGDGPGQIGVTGSDVRWGGVSIGLISSDGTWPSDLVIDFGSAATPAAVSDLLQALGFASSSDDPGAGDRQLALTITDDHGDTSAPQPAVVQVLPVNDPPSAPALTLGTLTDRTFTGTLAVSDPDGPGATVSVSVAALHGAVLILDAAAGTFRYQPESGFAGTDFFVLGIDDGAGGSATAGVTVHVTGPGSGPRMWVVTDPPLAASPGEALSWELRLDLSALAASPDLVWSLAGAPAGMTVTPSMDLGRATVTWTVPAGYGHLRFEVVAFDRIGGSTAVQSVVLHVVPPGGDG